MTQPAQGLAALAFHDPGEGQAGEGFKAKGVQAGACTPACPVTPRSDGR
jgi:hypothetical protein